MNEQASLLRVCSLLNQHKVSYLIVGARACGLHGYVRATIDVDIPYVDLATLIASKRTQRGQDQVDVQFLLSLDR
jgi:hypothetical protein